MILFYKHSKVPMKSFSRAGTKVGYTRSWLPYVLYLCNNQERQSVTFREKKIRRKKCIWLKKKSLFLVHINNFNIVSFCALTLGQKGSNDHGWNLKKKSVPLLFELTNLYLK